MKLFIANCFAANVSTTKEEQMSSGSFEMVEQADDFNEVNEDPADGVEGEFIKYEKCL